MRPFLLLIATLFIAVSCTSPPTTVPAKTSIPDSVTGESSSTVTPASPAITHVTAQSPGPPPSASAPPAPVIPDEVPWKVYDSDPNHLWNRLFRQLFRRMAEDGTEFGMDSLDPLLWYETRHLLEGSSHEQAIQLLDEFLSIQGEALVSDPLKRAMLQRDLWAVFDWLAFRRVDYPQERQALQRRLAPAIRRLALTEQEIRSLSGNYHAAVNSQAFPGKYQSEDPDKAFLPAGIFDPRGAWVCLGRAGGPFAMTHTEEFPFFGRSVFLVFIRIAGERQDTLDFIKAMNSPGRPDVPPGMEVALVRQMLHINLAGQIISTPIIESLQIRHFPTGQSQRFYQFILDRERLFAGQSGGLRPVEREFPLFRSHGVDWFEFGTVEAVSIPEIPELCMSCHLDGGLGIHGIQSILSYSRARFPLPDGERPLLSESTPELETQLVIDWKTQHLTWQELETAFNLQP